VLESCSKRQSRIVPLSVFRFGSFREVLSLSRVSTCFWESLVVSFFSIVVSFSLMLPLL